MQTREQAEGRSHWKLAAGVAAAATFMGVSGFILSGAEGPRSAVADRITLSDKQRLPEAAPRSSINTIPAPVISFAQSSFDSPFDDDGVATTASVSTAQSPVSPVTADSPVSPVSPASPPTADSPASPVSPASPPTADSPVTVMTPATPASPASPVTADSPASPASAASVDSPDAMAPAPAGRAAAATMPDQDDSPDMVYEAPANPAPAGSAAAPVSPASVDSPESSA